MSKTIASNRPLRVGFETLVDARPDAASDVVILDLEAIRPLVQAALRAHQRRKEAGIYGHREDGCVWCTAVPYEHRKAWQDWAEGGGA